MERNLAGHKALCRVQVAHAETTILFTSTNHFAFTFCRSIRRPNSEIDPIKTGEAIQLVEQVHAQFRQRNGRNDESLRGARLAIGLQRQRDQAQVSTVGSEGARTLSKLVSFA